MNKMQEGIMKIKNINTRMAIMTTYEKLELYSKEKGKDIKNFKHEDILDFFKRYYNNKSKTTIANAISNLKYLFEYIGKQEIMNKVNLYTMYRTISIKKNTYFTPSEIYEIVNTVPNFQDKALILLCYLGFYDTHYETIQNLKESNIKENYIEYKGKRVYITEFVSDIFQKAKEEVENISYTTGRTFSLKDRNGYFLRNKKSNKVEQDMMSVTCIKRKLQQIGEYYGIEDFTAVNIKNSRTIYDLVKLEYQLNNSLDINQMALKNYMKDTNTTGCLELLNVDKKSIKDKILIDIIKKEDFFVG